MQSLGNTLAQHLAEELGAATALLDLLRQEQAQLVEANVDALPGITEEKTKVVVRMTELAQARHRALAQAGFEASEAGMQAWTASPAAERAVSKSWHSLLDTAREAKELNRTNGLLIGQHAVRNQAALNVLQGSPQGGALYGPNGQAAGNQNSRRLVIG